MKLVTIIILGILLLGVIIGGYYYLEQDKKINIGGIEISSGDLKDLTEPIGEGAFVLCSIKDNKCILSQKRELE